MTKIAIHQMCSGIDPTANVENMTNAISQAGKAGALIYFAPEMSVLLDRDRTRAGASISLETETEAIRSLQISAADASIWVHSGSLAVRHETSDGRLANRSLIIDGRGRIRARYDKMHLFDVDLPTGETWRESAAYEPGKELVAVETPIGLMGLSICYDLRFPDLYSALSKAKVDAIAVPAAFTVPTGRAHWHTLLRARAIESQAFVIAAAQSGKHEDGRQTFGHSLVVDPWGEVILDMGDGEELGFAELDLARIAEVRTQIPVDANRREISAPVRKF